jgi:hypothetical protein
MRFGYGDRFEEIILRNIKLIGEYTNEDGPADDWFLALVVDKDGWYEIPINTDYSVEAVCETIGSAVGCKIDLQLMSSTTFKSRIIWPEHLRNEELFSFERSSAGWKGTLLCWSRIQRFSPRVVNYLESCSER